MCKSASLLGPGKSRPQVHAQLARCRWCGTMAVMQDVKLAALMLTVGKLDRNSIMLGDKASLTWQ